LNRAAIRATRSVGAGVDSVLLYHPHPAAIEGTLPRRVPAEGWDDVLFGVRIDALEVSDDLELLPKEIRKEGGFGAGGGVPCSATVTRRQARIALATEGVADQICRVSCWYCDGVGNGWRGNDSGIVWRRGALRRRVVDRAECTRKHESGYKQAPNSRSLFCLLAKVITHLFVLQFFVLFQLFEAVDVITTHNYLEGLRRITACGSERPYM
jgi:hypothetical protein